MDARWCDDCRNWIDCEEKECPVCQALRERDEARAKLEAIKQAMHTENPASLPAVIVRILFDNC